ncbi:Serine-threonine phosphatase catalytic subunit, partial [Tubulinosema ratisbonensis]
MTRFFNLKDLKMSDFLFFFFDNKQSINFLIEKEFLEKNDLETIIRGHEVEKMGYKLFKCYKTEVPSVYTVFSAPNYCDMYNNLGSTLFFDGNDYELKTYEWVNHPYVSKNYIDVISQTFSFVSEKVAEFYLDLLKYLEEINTTSSTLSKEESTISFTQKSYTEDEIKNEIINENNKKVDLVDILKMKNYKKKIQTGVQNNEIPRENINSSFESVNLNFNNVKIDVNKIAESTPGFLPSDLIKLIRLSCTFA